MGSDIEKLWELLLQCDIVKLFADKKVEHLDAFDKHSSMFVIFNLNINRALILYPLLLTIQKKADQHHMDLQLDFQYLHFCEVILICLITSMEVYLVDMFKQISSLVTVKDVDKRKFVDFLRQFRLEKEYLDSLKNYGNDSIPLSIIIPGRIDLQQKEKCKVAYSLIGIDLPRIVDGESKTWDKIFGNTKDSYVQMRHNIIHRGMGATVRLSQKLNIDLVESAILDVAKFVYMTDLTIVSKYPREKYPEIYPKWSK